MQKNRLFIFATLILPLSMAGCVDEPDAGDSMAEGDGDGDGDGTTGNGDGDGDGDPGPVDTDGDGLTDDEEAMLGTDPLQKDTDKDTYWDSWEVIEGTDPLDATNRIYTGYWPYNPTKDEVDQGTWETASTVVGHSFPRDSFLDHHGDYVDLYDFTHFKFNEESPEAYFIFDISAQWCGPCHNVANWIAERGNSADWQWIQDTYPTVREKVHSLRIWWITFIAQDSQGGAPTAADATSWYNTHQDAFIPILVDETQQVQNRFLGPAFPHFFLLDPEMKIEYFPPASGGTNEDPYPAVGLVDKYL